MSSYEYQELQQAIALKREATSTLQTSKGPSSESRMVADHAVIDRGRRMTILNRPNRAGNKDHYKCYQDGQRRANPNEVRKAIAAGTIHQQIAVVPNRS